MVSSSGINVSPIVKIVDLFHQNHKDQPDVTDGSHSFLPLPPSHAPLSERMRPRNLDEYVGQRHLLDPGKMLRRAVEADQFSSLLFFGPPGVGKTSLAQVIAAHTHSRFVTLSGVESSVSDLRREISQAEMQRKYNGRGTIVFIDEIHRFNKAQQDALLPHVEKGAVRLIGATTGNPLFHIIAPLVSRSHLFELKPLNHEDITRVLRMALQDNERGLGSWNADITDEALSFLAEMSEGDARKALNALDLATRTTPPQADGRIILDLEVAQQSIQKKAIVYDSTGDEHYNTISAFIKSMRGSDPDAALYWMAKMLHAGEDPRFIARRIVICASEDVGMADSNALRVAVAAHHALELVGMPEGRIPLAHAAIYVATAPKSNRAYDAINKAMADLEEGRTLAVPNHLIDKRSTQATISGRGNYQYSHDFDGAYVPQAYLPEGRQYYHPSEQGQELRVKERLEYWRKLFEASQEALSTHNPS